MKKKRIILLVSALALSLCSCGTNTSYVTGPQGEQGIQGEKGNDGLDGLSLLVGEESPDNSLGKNGDTYIDTTSFDYYLKKDGTWTKLGNIKGSDGVDGEKGEQGIQGEKGNDGSDGLSILSGQGEPNNSLGKDGDSYINTLTFDYYFKNDGAWTKIGNIKGSDGSDGEKGEQGIQGEAGKDGTNGKSAYDIYVENYPNYPGTEKDWISDLALGRLAVTVHFETNGGSELEDLTYCKGEEVYTSDFKTPTKEDFTFTNWYIDDSYTTAVSESFVALNDITLYASYEETSHSKGELISISTTSVEDVSCAGLFTCKYCGEEYYDSITYSDIGVPVICLDGDLTGISKTNEVKITSSYDNGDTSFDCDATLKVQGSSSAGYPKKNYNIKFYKSGSNYSKKNKVELIEGYGKQSKYTLKANYVDYSEVRNNVSGDIWGDIVRARQTQNELSALPNGGAVDGYPVLVFQNGLYQGLYTLNTPKNEIMFGMSDETVKQAIISTNTWNNSVALRENIAYNWSNGWEIEYCSTEDDENVGTSWIVTSFNEFMNFLNNNDGDALKEGLSNYVDIEAAIDTLIYTSFIYAGDNTAKNMLWATYDGTKWIPSMYDMDGTWGMVWDGSFKYDAATAWFPYTGNNLWNKIWTNYHDEVVERYQELRNSALSLNNISQKFSSFFDLIPDMLYEAESNKWTSVPSQKINNETQIMSWLVTRVRTMDSFFGVTVNDSAFKATFSIDNNGSIEIYKSQDYTTKPDYSLTAVARNSDTNLIDGSGDGQINFKVIVPEGYKIDTITINGTYKNLKGPEDTGVDNTYRITKVKSDLEVIVTLVKIDE